jgi:hypothetical protein
MALGSAVFVLLLGALWAALGSEDSSAPPSRQPPDAEERRLTLGEGPPRAEAPRRESAVEPGRAAAPEDATASIERPVHRPRRATLLLDDGTPVSGSTLTFHSAGVPSHLGSAVTDDTGSFEPPTRERGLLEVVVTWRGGVTRIVREVFDGARIVVASAVLRGRVDPAVGGGEVRVLPGVEYPRATFLGEVAGAAELPSLDESRRPVGGLSVPVDGEGRFEARLLRPVRVRLVATAPGFGSAVATVADRDVAREVVLRLRRAIDVPVSADGATGPVDRVTLRVQGRDVPRVRATLEGGRSVFRGLLEGASYHVVSETEPWVSMEGTDFTARPGEDVEVRLVSTTPTEVVVSTPDGEPIARAAVVLRLPRDHRGGKGPTGNRVLMGYTDAEGRWRGSYGWDVAECEVHAPPGPHAGKWSGSVPPGRSTRVTLGLQSRTRLRVRPTDCLLVVPNPVDRWVVAGAADVEVAEGSVVYVHSDGRYVFRRVKVRGLGAEADVVLERAVSCTFEVPDGTTNVIVKGRPAPGLPPMPLEGTYSISRSATEIEVRGLREGQSLSAFGATGERSGARSTPDVSFVAREGLRVVVPAR